jgi:lipopolysaccharide transport system ATP-binding protein
MPDAVIQVENLSKIYRIGLKEEIHDSLAGALVDFIKRPVMNLKRLRKLSDFSNTSDGSEDTIWALKDVSFEVRQGEVVGIIGRNGAGKSTLLKILCRITEPTRGRATVVGRVGALLEVGTGFHPELSGRENVYLNGVILGMKKVEVDKKFDEIVAFSEVEKFIDTPVKRYSSGMKVRLAFAVAAHLEPEILLVDEVLAVGDAAFQKKCLGKMQDVASEGRTVLFVSHNMGAINNLCSAGIVIDTGGITFQGQASEAVRFYLGRLNEQYTDTKLDGLVYFPVDETKEIQIRQVSVIDEKGKVGSVFEYHETAFISILFGLTVPNPDYYALVFVQDIYGNVVFFTADDDLTESAMAGLSSGMYRYRVELPNSLLKPGQYYVTVSLTQRHKMSGPHDRRDSVLAFEIIDNHTRRAARNGYRKPALVAPEIRWTLEPAEQTLP